MTELSVVVPAFNEAGRLADCVRSLDASLASLGVPAEIVIVDDGSTDGTAAVAGELARESPRVTTLSQANQGIGGAFRAGVNRATGNYVILWPADMPAEPSDLAPFVRALGNADVIVGSRRRRVGYNPVMAVNSWIYPRLVGALFDLRLRDVNWIHAYRRSLFTQITLTQRGIPMLAEALVRMRDRGAVIVEVPVEMKARQGGVPSASRPIVMWRTVRGLFSFWLEWRKEK